MIKLKSLISLILHLSIIALRNKAIRSSLNDLAAFQGSHKYLRIKI